MAKKKRNGGGFEPPFFYLSIFPLLDCADIYHIKHRRTLINLKIPFLYRQLRVVNLILHGRMSSLFSVG